MTVPSLFVQQQGVGVITADQANTYAQCPSYAQQLRSLTGVSTMMMLVGGNAAVGDGGAGVFYWNATSTAADDGTTVIAPSGSSTGRWVRLGWLSATAP